MNKNTFVIVIRWPEIIRGVVSMRNILAALLLMSLTVALKKQRTLRKN
jgi:hypothetical protein